MKLKDIKKVGVGSQNPVKVTAVKKIFDWLGLNVEVVGFSAPSWVSDQPRWKDETIKGAFNRAKRVLEHNPDIDIALGLEGGVEDIVTPVGQRMFLQGWTVAIDRDGKVGIGAWNYVELPDEIAEGLRGGEELGPLMDKLLGTKGIKHGSWTVGLLTKGYLDRTEAFALQVIMALSKWVSDLW